MPSFAVEINVDLCRVPGLNPAVSLVCLIVYPLALIVVLVAPSQSEMILFPAPCRQ